MVYLSRVFLILFASIAFSQAAFEGVISMRLSLEGGTGDMKFHVSDAATKVDMTMTISPLPNPINLTILLRRENPSIVYMLNSTLKTYSEISLEDADKIGEGPLDKEKYAVKVLGTGKILGYKSTHVMLSRTRENVDMWITKEVDVYQVFKRLQGANPQLGGEAALFKALEGAGLQGLPMKTLIVRDGDKVTMDVITIEKKKLNTNLFEIPQDYAKAEGFPSMPGTQPPTPKQLEEMKKMIEDALRGK